MKNIYVVELVITDDEDDKDRFSRKLQIALASNSILVNSVSIEKYSRKE